MGEDKRIGILRTLTSLFTRAQLADYLGQQFGGKRDLYNVYGYPTSLTPQYYRAKYERQDIAKRIVNAPAEATWKHNVEFEASPGFQKAFEELDAEFQLWNKFERVDKLAGLGRYSVLLLGFSGSSNLASPLTSGDLIYVTPYAESAVTIATFVTNTSDPRFGKPEMYQINVLDPSGLGQTSGSSQKATGALVEVHWSRIIHVADGALDSEVFGLPRLQSVYNLLEDLIKVSGGSAEMFWLSSNKGMQLDLDPEVELSPDAESALVTEVEEWQHELRRVLRTRGVTVKELGGQHIDPRGVFEVLINLISGATGIPQRILLGAEAGQLASDVDRANWADRVNERRKEFAEPWILMPTIKRFQDVGILPSEDNVKPKWPDAYELTPKETAEVRAQNARAVINLSRQAQFGEITSREEAREMVGLPPKMPPNSTDIGPGQVQASLETAGLDPNIDPNNPNAPPPPAGPPGNPPPQGAQPQQPPNQPSQNQPRGNVH